MRVFFLHRRERCVRSKSPQQQLAIQKNGNLPAFVPSTAPEDDMLHIRATTVGFNVACPLLAKPAISV